MPKVSVIIPVYNVEKYIAQCLDSLINQTLKDIEIICVDDGSTDNTLHILEQYREKDSRIYVYHQQNKFAGVARNNGMAHATGKYLIFLDSDDFFHKTMLEKAYNEAERTQAEVVLFGAKTYDDKTEEIREAPWLFVKDALPAELPFSAKKTGGMVLCGTTPAPWTKLYSAEYIHTLGIEYMALKNSNDVYFSYVAICCANRISYVDESLVFYRQNTGTSLQNTKKKNPLCFLEAYCASYEALNEKGVYEDVCRGFRIAVINGCLYNYNTVDSDTKHIIAESFLSEPFRKMDLLSGDEDDYTNAANVQKLRSLINSYTWKQKLNKLKTRKDAQCLVRANISFPPKVSVVIPCYNVENYVVECLKSICNQTLQEIEIICINDGATDRTLDILLNAASADDRITVLSQENSGLAFTRNQGVKAASGKYIYFMDSDDLLETDALEVLYNTAEKDRLDVVYFDAISFFESEELANAQSSYLTYYIRKHDYTSIVSGIDLLCNMTKHHEYRESACLQFINREFFIREDLWFIPGILHEDNAFSFKTILSAQKATHIPKTFFHRRVRGNSIVTAEVKFVHAYGQFISYLNMVETVRNKQFTLEQEAAVAQVMRNVMGNIRKKYTQLSDEEQLILESLSPIEQELFHTMVVIHIPGSAYDFTTSASYRIGRMITFLPRMIRATYRNLKTNGLGYTLKRIVWKIKSILSHK